MTGGENQVLLIALGIHAGLLLTNFFESFTRDIILPMISPLTTVEDGISKLIIQVGTVKLNIGDVIVRTINLLVGFYAVYSLVPLIKEYVPIAGRR
jgi:large-conductance mechanosensitive channel